MLQEKVLCYGLVGGIPQYLEKFNDSLSIEENIKESFLNKSSYFYDEPRNLLKQELREPQFYNTIIKVIAKGSSKLNQIATKVGDTFEEISIQYMRQYNDTEKLPFIFHSIGRWWANNSDKKREEEIDIICKNDNSIIFGECKWRNESINRGIVNLLIEK